MPTAQNTSFDVFWPFIQSHHLSVDLSSIHQLIMLSLCAMASWHGNRRLVVPRKFSKSMKTKKNIPKAQKTLQSTPRESISFKCWLVRLLFGARGGHEACQGECVNLNVWTSICHMPVHQSSANSATISRKFTHDSSRLNRRQLPQRYHGIFPTVLKSEE